MPSFVFVRARFKHDLLRALAMPISPHPAFSIFQLAGRAPVIADREIESLRKREDQARRAIRKTRTYAIPVGQKIRPSEGAFTGLDGIVEQVDGKTAFVCFGGTFRVKIATWMLVQDDVGEQRQIAA